MKLGSLIGSPIKVDDTIGSLSRGHYASGI